MSGEIWTIEKTVELIRLGEERGFPLLDKRAEVCAYFEIQVGMLREAFSDYFKSPNDADALEDVLNEINYVYSLEQRVYEPKRGFLGLSFGSPKTAKEKGEPWRWLWLCFGKVAENYLKNAGTDFLTSFFVDLEKGEIKSDISPNERTRVLWLLSHYETAFSALGYFFDTGRDGKHGAYSKVMLGLGESLRNGGKRGEEE